jgi:formiminotetrahydrofolate cyclodeaminase
MYLYGAIRSYAEAASSGQPAPGGGSVAALAGALGMTMGCMAANFTVGKKKFKAVEPEIRQLLGACLRVRDDLLRLMDEDTKAYAAVSAAYAMPKETPEQAAARTAMIQKALLVAMDAPLRVIRACRSALEPIARLADIGNPNLISDVGVATILAEAALRAAKLNVEINLRSLEDKALSSATRGEIERAADEARAIARLTMEKVVRAMGGTL